MSLRLKYFCLLSCLLFGKPVYAQVKVYGAVSDKKGDFLTGCVVKVLGSDSTFVDATTCDTVGVFSFNLPAPRQYIFIFSFLGYRDRLLNVDVKTESLYIGNITLRPDFRTLSEVEIQAVQARGEQRGDTTLFKADAFVTHVDASAEELLKKMPGITSDNGGLKVNGENVQKVLVDGKPFFGDDPNAAVKNLPAEIIDKVEIFDKLSDQSQFTGFNDGNQQKTINLVTKKGKNNGQFGKVYAGAGADEKLNARYSSGAVLNSFKEKQRLTLMLLSNNINQQNFNAADLTGAMAGSAARGRMAGKGEGTSLLAASPQSGISATQAAGLNYSDAWGKKIEVAGSYFFNYSDNKNATELLRQYFTGNKLVYSQNSDEKNINLNHRANLRFEYNIDTANKLIVSPSFNFQNHNLRSALLGSNTIFENQFLSSTDTKSNIDNMAYDFSNAILLQHKFRKESRTISLNLQTQLAERNNDGSYEAANNYGDSISGLNQLFNTYGNNKRVAANLSFTEPLNKNAQLLLSYNPSYNEGISDRITNDFDGASGTFSEFNSSLSNKYKNVYEVQRGGLSYKYRKDKLNLSIGVDLQQSLLKGDQTFPTQMEIRQNFRNILPNAQLNYKINKSRNLRVNYRTSTNIPNISQLQSVIDVSNPLQIKTGNTALQQTFENNISIRFGGFNPASARNAMLFVNAGNIENYVSNQNVILRNDTNVQGFLLKSGTQLTRPVNLSGYYQGKIFGVYGLPLNLLKSNLNVNGGLNYNRTPALMNDVLNYSSSYSSNLGLFLGSNISQNLDFSLGYNINYTSVKNTVQKKSDNDFFNHASFFKINWVVYKGLILNSDITHTVFNGLSQSFNQSYFLWNTFIGYKFLSNKSLEAKVSVFDLLDQNRSIGRTVTGNFTEDNNTVVLKRYMLFTLTYTFRHFKGNMPPPAEQPGKQWHGERRGDH